MTFRNDRQRAKACRVLLQFQGLERFWASDDIGTAFGPTVEATIELAKVRSMGSLLSTSEGLLLRVAFDFWNGAGFATLWDVQSHLNVNIIHAIGELLIAANEDLDAQGAPVEKWVETWRRFRLSTVYPAGPLG